MSFAALTRANFQLSGGWRQNAVIVGVYAGLVAVIAFAVYRFAGPKNHADVSAVFLGVVTALQGGLVLLIGPGAVRRAVLRDFQTGMIDSHRLTPLSGLSLVAGYVTGPTAQAALLYGAGLALGTYFAAEYGQSFGLPGLVLSGWYASQVSLLTLAALVTAMILLTALATRGKTNLTLVLLLLGVFGGYWLLILVPGLALLTGVMGGFQILRVLTGSGPGILDPAVVGWAMLLQLVMATVLLAACCRKVRALHSRAINVPLGLVLLLVSGFTLALGMRFLGGLRLLFEWDEGWRWQWGASIVVFILVALFPLVAAASQRQRGNRAAALELDSGSVRLRLCDVMPLLLALLTAVLIVEMLPPEQYRVLWSDHAAGLRSRLVALSVAVLLSFGTDYALVSAACAHGRSPKLALIFSWLVLKLLPLAVDAIAAVATELGGEPAEFVWRVAYISPIGTLIGVAQDLNSWPGIAVQGVIAAVAAVIAIDASARTRSPQATRAEPRASGR